MVNIYSAYKKSLHVIMWLAGMKPMTVDIEPGTVMNFWVPAKPNSTKPSVVFLHGFAADGIFTWQFQVLALARNYAVYVPDFLFFGDVSFTTSSHRSPEFQAVCVAKGLRKLGVKNSTLVGLSYGGMVGFKLAELEPDLVDSMVVTCSVMALTESISKAGLDRIGFSKWSDFLLPKTVNGVKLISELGNYKSPWMPQWVFQHLFEAIFDNRKEKEELLEALIVKDKDFHVPNCTQRIHLLWGKEDIIFNNEVANNIKEQLGGKATLQYIEEAGHLPELERPCIYNQYLKEFLASLIELRSTR